MSKTFNEELLSSMIDNFPDGLLDHYDGLDVLKKYPKDVRFCACVIGDSVAVCYTLNTECVFVATGTGYNPEMRKKIEEMFSPVWISSRTVEGTRFNMIHYKPFSTP